MYLEHHYQNAYITHDLGRALAVFKAKYNFDRFKEIEVTQKLTVRGKQGEATVKLALGWIGDLQYELIQPVSGLVDVYTDDLRSKYALEFHHVCMRVKDNWAEFRAGLDRDECPVVMEGGTPGHLQFVYVDARDTLGHYLEYCWMTPERWAAMRAL